MAKIMGSPIITAFVKAAMVAIRETCRNKKRSVFLPG